MEAEGKVMAAMERERELRIRFARQVGGMCAVALMLDFMYYVRAPTIAPPKIFSNVRSKRSGLCEKALQKRSKSRRKKTGSSN